MENNIVSIGENNQAVTTSMKVAEVFEKAHKNVLRDIEAISCSEKFRQLNFELSFNTRMLSNGGSKKEPYYKMTKDGFVFLVMGYNGIKAGEFKEKYIAAFNEMEKIITDKMVQINAEHEQRLLKLEQIVYSGHNCKSYNKATIVTEEQIDDEIERAANSYVSPEREKIKALVREYAITNGCIIHQAWIKVYNIFCRKIHKTLPELKKKASETWLDAIERKGKINILLESAMEVNNVTR